MKKGFCTLVKLTAALALALAVTGNVHAQRGQRRGGPERGTPTPLQQVWNSFPALPIPVVGTLKFDFYGDVWVASRNGSETLAGSITVYETSESNILVLKPTHAWVRVAWVPTPGPEIKLEHRIGSAVPFGLYSGDIPPPGAVMASGDSSSDTPGTETPSQAAVPSVPNPTTPEGIIRDIQLSQEWMARLSEVEESIYRKINAPEMPYTLFYSTSVEFGDIDYRTGSADINFTVNLHTDRAWMHELRDEVQDVYSGLNSTGRKTAWGLDGWPIQGVSDTNPFAEEKPHNISAVFELMNGDRVVAERPVDFTPSFNFTHNANNVSVNYTENNVETVSFASVGAGELSGSLSVRLALVNGAAPQNAGINAVALSGSEWQGRLASGFVDYSHLAPPAVASAEPGRAQGTQQTAAQPYQGTVTGGDKSNSFKTLGFSVGSTFTAPAFVLGAYGSVGRTFFWGAGFDIGMGASGREYSYYDGEYSIDSYFSFYPYTNLGFFVPGNNEGGFYMAAGIGVSFARIGVEGDYYRPYETYNVNPAAFDLTMGFLLGKSFNISYTVRNFSNSKLAMGFLKRFK